ncbi:g7152 [Coccomyxa elongata]
MGSCASKSQFDREVEEVIRERPDAAATVYSSKQGTPAKDLGLVKGQYSQYNIPVEPETPRRDTIPARPSPYSATESFDKRPSPLPTSKAPAGVVLSSQLALPYAAPYIPPPSLPPPEYAHLATSSTWLPGRKRALLVAANYSHVPDPQAHLRGCANDVHCLKHLLISKFGFQDNNIVLLHDEQPHEDYWPTKENILSALSWLVSDCQAQDSLVFAFSGHGSLDTFSNEQSRDGILPCDFLEAGPIYEDELYEAVVARLVKGSRLHCFVDTCRGIFALGLPSCVYTRADGWSNWEEDERGPVSGTYASLRPQPEGEVVMLSSTLSEDEDLDMDATDYSQYASTGAVTFSLIQAVEQGQAATYNVLLRAMRYSLKNGPQHFPKLPELSASEDFDLNRPFLL